MPRLPAILAVGATLTIAACAQQAPAPEPMAQDPQAQPTGSQAMPPEIEAMQQDPLAPAPEPEPEPAPGDPAPTEPGF